MRSWRFICDPAFYGRNASLGVVVNGSLAPERCSFPAINSMTARKTLRLPQTLLEPARQSTQAVQLPWGKDQGSKICKTICKTMIPFPLCIRSSKTKLTSETTRTPGLKPSQAQSSGTGESFRFRGRTIRQFKWLKRRRFGLNS